MFTVRRHKFIHINRTACTRTQRKADMATRLVNGLADENVRWTEAVKNFDQQEAQFVGDVLVVMYPEHPQLSTPNPQT